jgi:hypothetical protein
MLQENDMRNDLILDANRSPRAASAASIIPAAARSSA